jgi:CubicO group peptidase (beta-lactamase class C family)
MKNLSSILLILFCAQFTFAQTKEIDSAVSKSLDSFENEISKDIDGQKIAGGAYLVYHRGKVIRKKAFGEMDKASHKPMSTSAIFRLASMTKPIASLALLFLQEDGLINMNDRLDQYLPAFANQQVIERIDTLRGSAVYQTRKASKPILLRHLLTHTAGFASQYGGNLASLYYATFDTQSSYDLTHFVNELSKLPLVHEPGDDWIYGPSLNVAARVIEVVTGMPFQVFLQKRIFDPLQMKDTQFYLKPSDAPRLATQYMPGMNGMEVKDPGSLSSNLISGPQVFFSASGGLTSTLDDYLKFCVMVMNNGVHEGKVFAKPETIALLKTDQTPLAIHADFLPSTTAKTEGFTFGYQIVRKESNRSLKPKGTISWGGATGPIFFIDPSHELIGIYMFQMQPHSQVPTRKSFADFMISGFRN